MKKGTMQDLADHLRRMEEYREKHFSEKKLREVLGDEPWNREIVYECYLKNPSALQNILRNHKGYKIYANMLEYRSFINIVDKYYHSICDSIDYHKGILASNDGGEKVFEILGSASANVNVLFWGYATACFASIESETYFLNKYMKKNKEVTEAYESILGSNDAHFAVMLLRNHLCHGKLMQFNCNYNKDYERNVGKIKFYIRKEKIELIKVNYNTKNSRSIEKNTIGKKYLEDDSNLMHLLENHYPAFKRFHAIVLDVAIRSNIEKIAMCNSYFKEIYMYWQGLAANMAKTIGQPAPKRYVPESDTYYLEYAMNEGAGNLSLGFKLPDVEEK